MVPRIITDTTVTVQLDGDILVANSAHPAFQQIRSAALAQDWQQVRTLMDVGKAIETWSDNEFQISDNQVLYMGEPVPAELERRILSFLEEDAPFDHLLEFYRRLRKNPSRRSVHQLYKFLEHENIPIGEDGCFYAYKAVQQDWYSISADRRTGQKQLNTIGMTPSMPRNEVDDDPTHGCSYGFHVGSLNYASGFGGSNSRLLICRVAPENVVSVPHDCAYQKLRCSEYTVVQEYVGPLPNTYWSPDQPVWDEGVFPDSDLDDRIATLEEEIADCEDQIERLQVAVDAAEDAGSPPGVIEGLLNAMQDVESQMLALESDLDELVSERDEELYEG
jgi:uncharacterized coiled-coil protein SlyX